jgi:predicted lipoprotein with Yx(FWY)xxD motif
MRLNLNRARLLGLSAAGVAAIAGGGAVAMAATSQAAVTPHAAKTTLGVKKNAQLGSILDGGSSHLTLYVFTADKGGKSHCTGACLKSWPALTTTGTAKPALSGGLKASLVSSISHGKGVRQVTYAGHPLYYFAGDKSAATAAGQDIDALGGHWYVINTAGKEITKSAASSTAPTTSTPSAPAPTTTTPTTPAAPVAWS